MECQCKFTLLNANPIWIVFSTCPGNMVPIHSSEAICLDKIGSSWFNNL